MNIDDMNLNEVFKSNPLKEVSFMMGFSHNLRILRNIADFHEKISTTYPNIEYDEESFNGNYLDIFFVFSKKDRSRIVKISHNQLFITFYKYEKFEELKSQVLEIVKYACDTFDIPVVSSPALQYINSIRIFPKQDRFPVEKYINVPLKSTSEQDISRFLTEVFLYDSESLMIIRNRFVPVTEESTSQVYGEYLLEFISVKEGEGTIDNLENILDLLHQRVKIEFLKSTTETYKKDMRQGNV